VTQDFETRWHFNSAIALVMELTNEIYLQEPLEKDVAAGVRKEVLELLTLMLAPMTPHLAEELWEMMGHADGLWKATWPAFDEALTQEDEVEIPVQVNGRLRGKVKVAVGAGVEEVENLARADAAIGASSCRQKRREAHFRSEQIVESRRSVRGWHDGERNKVGDEWSARAGRQDGGGTRRRGGSRLRRTVIPS